MAIVQTKKNFTPAALNWQTNARDCQLLDEPGDYLGQSFTDAQYRAHGKDHTRWNMALSVTAHS